VCFDLTYCKSFSEIQNKLILHVPLSAGLSINLVFVAMAVVVGGVLVVDGTLFLEIHLEMHCIEA